MTFAVKVDGGYLGRWSTSDTTYSVVGVGMCYQWDQAEAERLAAEHGGEIVKTCVKCYRPIECAELPDDLDEVCSRHAEVPVR